MTLTVTGCEFEQFRTPHGRVPNGWRIDLEGGGSYSYRQGEFYPFGRTPAEALEKGVAVAGDSLADRDRAIARVREAAETLGTPEVFAEIPDTAPPIVVPFGQPRDAPRPVPTSPVPVAIGQPVWVVTRAGELVLSQITRVEFLVEIGDWNVCADTGDVFTGTGDVRHRYSRDPRTALEHALAEFVAHRDQLRRFLGRVAEQQSR